MIRIGLFLAFLFGVGLSQADSSKEVLNYSPTRAIRIEIACIPKESYVAVIMKAQKRHKKPFPFLTSLSAEKRCDEAISFDEDFDGDGTNDIAINDLSLSKGSMREILLVSKRSGHLYRAGYLPLDATIESPGTYNHIETVGGSMFKTTYTIREMKIIRIRSMEKIIDGGVCTNPVKTLLGEGACKGKILDASFSRPVCIRHQLRQRISKIEPNIMCDF